MSCLEAVLCSLLILSASSATELVFGSYRNEIRGLFRKVAVSSFSSLSEDSWLSGNEKVKSLAADYQEGFVLLALIGNAVLSVDKDGFMEVIAGEINEAGYSNGEGNKARLNNPYDIMKVSKDVYIISDSQNHCLRTLERTTPVISGYTGRCQLSGGVDGNATMAEYSHPTGLVLDIESDRLYVADGQSSGRLRTIERTTVVTTTTIRSLPFGSMNCFISGRTIFVTYKHGIVALDLENDHQEVFNIGSQNTSGYTNGWLSKSQFNHPQGVVVLGNLITVVADTGNDVIRHIDYGKKKVRDLSSFVKEELDGINKRCTSQPHALLVADDTLYVGGASDNQTYLCSAVVTETYNLQMFILLIILGVLFLFWTLVLSICAIRYRLK